MRGKSQKMDGRVHPCVVYKEQREEQAQASMRSCFGLIGSYRRFVKGFAGIATPIPELVNERHPWVWVDNREHARMALQGSLRSCLPLTKLDQKATLILFTDAPAIDAAF